VAEIEDSLDVIISAEKKQEKIEKIEKFLSNNDLSRERRGKNSLELCSQAFEILHPVFYNSLIFKSRKYM